MQVLLWSLLNRFRFSSDYAEENAMPQNRRFQQVIPKVALLASDILATNSQVKIATTLPEAPMLVTPKCQRKEECEGREPVDDEAPGHRR